MPLTFAPKSPTPAPAAPIVALESTIITHGMPYPQNLEVARQVEADIRAAGATPATIAVIDGALHIGLERRSAGSAGAGQERGQAEPRGHGRVHRHGRHRGHHRRGHHDRRPSGRHHVFATGGIGGVHKGAEDSFDISADLMELAQTPVTVVAAGAKAILDVAKTLEVLETQGVPVIAYGQDSFPAFWSRSSQLNAPLRMDDRRKIAARTSTRAAMGCPADSWWPTRSRTQMRSQPPNWPRSSPGTGRCRRPGHHRQGGHPLPAATHFRADRGPVADREYRACAQQCPAGGADCRSQCADKRRKCSNRLIRRPSVPIVSVCQWTLDPTSADMHEHAF